MGVVQPQLNQYIKTLNDIDKILDVLPYGYVPEPSPNHAMERIFGCFVYNDQKEIKIVI